MSKDRPRLLREFDGSRRSTWREYGDDATGRRVEIKAGDKDSGVADEATTAEVAARQLGMSGEE